MPTLIDIATGRSAPISLGVLRQVITSTPLLNAFDARTSPNTRFTALALVALPGGSGFVRFGGGYKAGEARWEPRQFDCAYIGGMVQAHMDLARRWEVEHPDAEDDYFTTQAALRIAADLLLVEKQIIYGWGNDALGFPGLKQTAPGTLAANVYSLTETPDDTDFTKSVINAGGSTSATASSVYAIEFGKLACQLVMGGATGGGELFTFGERKIQAIAPDSTKPLELADHELGQYSGHIGLSIAGYAPVADGETVPGQYCLRRLMNVTNDSGCGVDDYKMEKLVQSFPDGHVPSILTMSHRSGDQWAKSRSATGSVTIVGSSSGRDGQLNRQPARPTEYEGIPIVYTRAIRNNDAIEVPA